MNDPQSVYLLTIMHRYGTEFYAFSNEEAARRQLVRYVIDGWDDVFPLCHVPDEDDDAVFDYFEGNEQESYILVKEPILEEPV